MNSTTIGAAFLTGIFSLGIMYGLNGGSVPPVAVIILSTIGATIFGIAAVFSNK